jgi:alpha/beta superfamily hydrolase
MAHIPENRAGKVPMVILFHGFTADRNEALFIHTTLSRMLCEKGIASVRFDFAGSGESDGVFSDMTLDTQAADGEAILDFVKTLDYVDNRKIALHGMSMGGATAALLSGRRAQDIAAVSLWSPAACAIEDARNKNMKGIAIPHIEQEGKADIAGIELGVGFYYNALELDLYATAAKFDKNVNLVHGDRDDIVPLRCSERFLEIYGARATLTRVHGADHDYAGMEYQRQRLQSAIAFLTKELL